MTFTSLLERVSRKSISLKNKVFRQKLEKIQLLGDLMRNSPRSHAGAQDWVQQCSDLIECNLLDRISKKDIALILAGLVSYKNTGVTPQSSHMALVRAYENSSGMMQDLLHTILFSTEIEAGSTIKSTFFGQIKHSDVAAIQKELDEQGYVVLPWRLDQSWIDALVAEAGNLGYLLRDPAPEEREIKNRKIDPVNPPKCVAAYAKTTDLTTNQLFSEFSNDPLLVSLASRHINANALPIDLSLWYSFASATPSSEAAQLFHYDLDTLRWLKVFVYLTDVGPDNGPHEYVPASHKPGTKPQALMDREYGRLKDEEIDAHCPQGRKSICGPRGTVILGDTNCLHKGNAVLADYRLIFSPIYAASRVGYFHGE
jgi:Phytanoyl-CoA dioxygenase (PhyH)